MIKYFLKQSEPFLGLSLNLDLFTYTLGDSIALVVTVVLVVLQF